MKRTFRYHNKVKSDTFTKTKAVVGAALGATAAVAVMAKKQHVKPWNIEYGLGELIGLAASAITGGVAVGSIGASKEDKKEKRAEGLFQFLNSALPAALVTGGIKMLSSSAKYNTPIVKGSMTVVGLLLGMQLASNLTNKITDPHNKVTDRKLGFKDALANIDDALGVFVILKPKKAGAVGEAVETTSKKTASWLQHVKIENILPVVAAWCGYRAGQTN